MRDDWRTDIENAPKDGSDVLFPLEFVGRAYWDAELERWILCRPLHMESVPHPTRYQLPKAQRDIPATVDEAIEQRMEEARGSLTTGDRHG